MKRLSHIALHGVLASCLLAALPAYGQLPTAQLTSVFPAGARQGTAVEVEIAGADLEGVERLSFSHPGIKAEVKRAPPVVAGLAGEPIPNRFIVTVGRDVPPGLYDVRAVGRFGISNPRTFAVGQLNELGEEPSNTSPEKAMRLPLNSVVNGRSGAGQVDYFRFTADKGQRVLVELWAERLDSRLDATISLIAPDGRELAHSRDHVGRDPLIAIEIPAAGDYSIAVFDVTYQGGADYFYRLAVHTGPLVEYVFPPCGLAGSKTAATIFGYNLPNSTRSALKSADRLLDQRSVTIQYPAASDSAQLGFVGLLGSRAASVDGLSYRWPTPSDAPAGTLLTFASSQPVAEQEPNDTPDAAQHVQAPCEVAGWFSGADDADWYDFDAKGGQVFWLEVICQRLGQSADPSLLVQRVVRDKQGKEQATDIGEADDPASSVVLPGFPVASSDPDYRFVAPADGTYRVLLRDLAGGQSPRLYAFALRQPQPDFRLVAVPMYPSISKTVRPWSVFLRRGGTAAIDVVAFRRDGFDGPIELTATGLPPGIAARLAVVGAGQQSAQLVFQSALDGPTWAGTIEVVGMAPMGGKSVTRFARSGTVLWSHTAQRKAWELADGRMTHGIALAATADESLPVTVGLPSQPLDMCRAGKLTVPVKLLRRGHNDALTLTAHGLPPKFKVASLTIPAGKTEAPLTVDVPAAAAPGDYSFVLRGEAKLNYHRDEAGLRIAKEHKTKLEKLAADAKEQLKSAATDTARHQVEADIKALAAALAAADKRVIAATAAAQPKSESVLLYSTPARLKVTAAPVELRCRPVAPAAKGSQVKVPVAVLRRYNYAEKVVLGLLAGSAPSDVKVEPLTIGPGKDAAELLVTVGPKTPPGNYHPTLRATVTFNGQKLETDASLDLTVK